MSKIEKVIEVDTKGDIDCHECCFSLECFGVCCLPKGRHYEKRLIS